MSIRHEAILNFLLANPLVKMGHVAAHFGVTQGWLSCIVHSDAFQARLAERQDMHFDASVLPAMAKVQVAADLALERMIELLPIETDVAKLNAVADKALTRLGLGQSAPSAAPSVTVNIGIVEDLRRARELIVHKETQHALSPTGENPVGQASDYPTLPAPAPQNSGAKGGDSI